MNSPLATEGRGYSGSYGEIIRGQRELYTSRSGMERRTNDRQILMPSPHQAPNSTAMPTLDLEPGIKISVPEEDWDDTFTPESPPPTTVPDFDASFDTHGNGEQMGHNSTVSKDFFLDDLEVDSDSRSDYYSMVESEVETPNSSTPKCGICAVIFQKSSRIPITIMVTSPDEETANPLEFTPGLQRSGSRFSLTSLNSNFPATNSIDYRLLTPPAEKQLDSRKLHKAFEARQIRKWLIGFLNSRGDQFPRNIRLRMMEMYGIREFDLAPEIVQKFNAEMQDEGVFLEPEGQLGAAESLRILGEAFRSQIEEMTPKKEKVRPLHVPRQHKSSSKRPELKIPDLKRPESKKPESKKPDLKRPESKKSESKKPQPKKPEPKKPGHEKQKKHQARDKTVLSRARPVTGTSRSLRDSLPSDPQHLKHANSAPNLHPSPSRPVFNSSQSSPSIRSAHSSTGEGPDSKQFGMLQRQGSIKRNSILSNPFGALKDAFSRRTAKKDENRRSWNGSVP